MMISPLRREFLSKNEMAEAKRLDPAKVVLCERLMKVMKDAKISFQSDPQHPRCL